MGRKIFRRTNQPFVRGWAGRALSSEARWVGASISGAAGIRWCDLRCPESVGIIRVASGDGEQETIADFPRRFRTPPRIMRRAAQVGLVAGRGTDFLVRGWGFTNPSAESG